MMQSFRYRKKANKRSGSSWEDFGLMALPIMSSLLCHYAFVWASQGLLGWNMALRDPRSGCRTEIESVNQ